MSFLYPRTITITRASHQVGVGAISHGGKDQAKMITVATDVPCNVQSKSGGRINPTGLPADTMAATWSINIPKRAGIPAGTIRDRDLIVDDLGRRFQVTADYCHSLGWRLGVDRLEK